jgi:acyl-coenzyme A synthetase/AMP-(fatty) acid ligase
MAAALEQAPSVENVVVVRRTGGDIAWKDGRDHWYHELIAQQPAACEVGPGSTSMRRRDPGAKAVGPR